MTWDTGEPAKNKRKKPKKPPRGSGGATGSNTGGKSADGKPAGGSPNLGGSWGDSEAVAVTRSRRKLAVIIGSSVVGLVLLVILATPLVAGMLAPGIIAGRASEGIAGRVEVDSVRLGWFRGQTIENLRVFDPDDDRVASVDVRIDRGLLGVVLGGMNLGTVEVSGRADIVRDDDGTTNLDRAIAPAGSARADSDGDGDGSSDRDTKSEPLQLPASLRARIEITGLSVSYADPALLRASGGTIGIVKAADLTGRVEVADGGDVGVRLEGAVRTAARTDDDGSVPAGSIDVRVSADRLIDGDGVVRLGPSLDAASMDGMKIDARIELGELSVALVDALGQQEGRLVAGLGEVMSLTFEAEGPADAIETTLSVESAAVDLSGAGMIDLAAARVRTTETFTIAGRTERLSAFAGGLVAELERGAGVRIASWPEARLTLRDLDLPLPMGDDPIDLRGGGAVVELALGAASGSVPSPDGGTASAWRVETAPLALTIEARDLAAGLSIVGETGATIDGTDAGRVAVNLRLDDLLGPDGSARTSSLPGIGGSVAATNLALGLLQPLVEDTGLVLARDVGSTVNITADAAPAPDGGRQVRLEARASNVIASAGLFVSAAGDRVSLDGNGARVELRSIGPTATRLARNAGVEIVSAQPFVLNVERFDAPVAGLVAGDLREVGVAGALAFGETTGWVTLPDTGTTGRRHVILTGTRVGIDTRRLGDGLRLRLNGEARVDNRPAGGMTGDLFVAGVLTPSGGVAAGVPSSFSGELRLSELATEVLQPLVTEAGLVLSEDVGPTIDVRVRANAGVVGAPRGGATDLVVTVDSQHANGRAELAAEERVFRTTGRGITFQHTGAGALAARVAGLLSADTGLTVSRAGELRLEVSRLRLPVDPVTRAPMLDDADLSFEATLDTVSLVRADGREVELDRLVMTGGTDASRGFDLSLNAGLKSDDRPFSFAIEANVPGLSGSPLATARATATLTNMPVSVVGLLSPMIETPEGTMVDAGELLAGFVGESITARVQTDPAGGDTRSARVDLSGTSLFVESRAGLALPAGGPPALTSFALDGSLEISPASFTRGLTLAGIDPRGVAEAPDAVRGSGPASAPVAPLRLDEPVAVRVSGELRGRDRIEIEVRTDRIALSGLEAFANTPRPVGPVVAEVIARLASPFSPDPAAMTGPATLRIESAVRTRQGSPLATITADASAPLSAGVLQGEGTLRAAADRVDPRFLDRVLGGDDLVAEALGGALTVRLDGTADLARGALRSARATLTPEAPRLRVEAPVRMMLRDDFVELAEPFDIEWVMTGALATGLLTPPPDASGVAAEPPVRIPSQTVWRFRGDELRLPVDGGEPGGRGDAAARVGLNVIGGAVRVRLNNGREIVYPSTTFSARSAEQGGMVNVTAEITGGANARAATFNGRLEGVGTDDPALTGSGELSGLTTALIDAFADGGGRITRVLGPTVSGAIELRNFPRLRGTIALEGTSPNAKLDYQGEVRNPTGGRRMLVAARPAELRLSAVDRDASLEMRDFVPAFAQVTKTPGQHQPGVVTVNSLSLPFDGGLTEVTAEATVDPGEFGFEIDGQLKALLSASGQATQGRLLERFGAVEVTLRNGVATYDKLDLPIGEYVFESSGIFDLVAQTEQVTLWAPLTAIAVENLRLPVLDASSVINPDAQVPIRKSGPLGNPDNPWRIDLAGSRGQLIRPADLKDAATDIIKDLLPGG